MKTIEVLPGKVTVVLRHFVYSEQDEVYFFLLIRLCFSGNRDDSELGGRVPESDGGRRVKVQRE